MTHAITRRRDFGLVVAPSARAHAADPARARRAAVFAVRALSDRREHPPGVLRMGRLRPAKSGSVLATSRSCSPIRSSTPRSPTTSFGSPLYLLRARARPRAGAVAQPGGARHPADPRAVPAAVRDQPGRGRADVRLVPQRRLRPAQPVARPARACFAGTAGQRTLGDLRRDPGRTVAADRLLHGALPDRPDRDPARADRCRAHGRRQGPDRAVARRAAAAAAGHASSPRWCAWSARCAASTWS